jgi:hypothetical protein
VGNFHAFKGWVFAVDQIIDDTDSKAGAASFARLLPLRRRARCIVLIGLYSVMFEMMMRIDQHITEFLRVFIAGMDRMGAILNPEMIELSANPRQMGHIDDLKTEIREMAQVIRGWIEDQKFVFIIWVMFIPSFGREGATGSVQGEYKSNCQNLKNRITKVLPNLVKTCRIAEPLPS